MSTCSRVGDRPRRCGPGRTLKPMMMAFDADASSTSDSLIAPTPAWMMRILTFSSLSLVSVSASTSAEPCTSALMMIGSSFMPPSAICACSDSSVSRAPLRAERARPSPAPGGRSRSAAPSPRRPGLERRRPAAAGRRGRALRPASTAPPTCVGRPRSSISARTRADNRAGDERVADVQRAVLDEHGRDRAAAFVELRFEHGARRAALRVGLELDDVADEQDHLEQRVDVLSSAAPTLRP